MGAGLSSTAGDIVKAALRRITSYQSGEQVGSIDMQDCLDTLNDLLDSWSTDEFHVPGVTENIVTWTAGKNEYKIGNPLCTELGFSPFTGVLTSGSNIITGITTMPPNIVVGATLTALSNAIPLAYVSVQDVTSGVGVKTLVTAVGANTITMSNNATASVAADLITYTVPGDFLPAFGRPLMITAGFTRFNNLDFTLDIGESQNEYTSILYKPQPGPWPTVAWYNPTYPYGIMKVYQTPANNAELHLFTKVILGNLQATSQVVLPQGYARALKWCLAREIWVEYVNPTVVPIMLEKLASESRKAIMDLNSKPAQRSKYDRALVRGNRADGGWIFYGGYR